MNNSALVSTVVSFCFKWIHETKQDETLMFTFFSEIVFYTLP